MSSAAKSKRAKREKDEKEYDTDSQVVHAGKAPIVAESKHASNGNGKGDSSAVTEKLSAQKERPGSERRRATEQSIDSLCRTLQSLERQRRFALKQCIRGDNSITAFVAWNACGFHTGLPTEAEREKLWKEAVKLIKQIDSGERYADAEDSGAADNSDLGRDADRQPAADDEEQHDTDSSFVQDEGMHDTDSMFVQNEKSCDTEIPNVHDDSSDDTHIDTEVADVTGVIRVSKISRDVWANYEMALMSEMSRLAGQLPVAPWVSTKECRGISLGILATIVGEAGNLSNYPNPAKLWKRLFGAPVTKNGQTKMPSRWRLEKGLSKEEWEEVGYSPQRHATMQQLKENIVRQNMIRDRETKEVVYVGPYRLRYDEAKERTRETHPEWWICSKCKGKGATSSGKCQNCKGTGEVSLHAHRHAQLLAAKRFVRDLWNCWHGVVCDA